MDEVLSILLSWQRLFARVVMVLGVLVFAYFVYKLGYRNGSIDALEAIVAQVQHSPAPSI